MVASFAVWFLEESRVVFLNHQASLRHKQNAFHRLIVRRDAVGIEIVQKWNKKCITFLAFLPWQDLISYIMFIVPFYNWWLRNTIFWSGVHLNSLGRLALVPWKFDDVIDVFLNNYHINWLNKLLSHQLFGWDWDGPRAKCCLEGVTGCSVALSYHWVNIHLTYSSTFRAIFHFSKEGDLRELAVVFLADALLFWLSSLLVFVTLVKQPKV